MELAFESKSLRTICESEADAQSELGPTVAEALRHRLADLRVASSINDLVAGKPRLSDDANDQHCIIDLAGDYSIVLGANHPRNPLMGAGKLDWARISRVKLLRIESDHD